MQFYRRKYEAKNTLFCALDWLTNHRHWSKAQVRTSNKPTIVQSLINTEQQKNVNDKWADSKLGRRYESCHRYIASVYQLKKDIEKYESEYLLEFYDFMTTLMQHYSIVRSLPFRDICARRVENLQIVEK